MACIEGKVLIKQLFTNYTFLASNCNIRHYKYEKVSEKIRLWGDKKKKKAKRKLHRTERGVEKAKMKAKQRFIDDNERIEIIVASARTHAYESQMKEELKVKEKANLMRTTGQSQCTCL
ncbi:hypothetical protein Bca101_027356 [Brassica carinata]